MAEPRITVEAPARSPRLGGLLSVADVRDNVQGLLASTNIQYDAQPCELAYNDAGFCYSDATGDAQKTYEGIVSGVSVVPNFAAYYGVECFISNESDMPLRASAGLEFSESRNIEAKFFVWLSAGAATAASDIVAAIAAAEHNADLNYIGRPVIHLNRGDAVKAAAAQAIWADGSSALFTANGTPVVASSQYTAGSLYVSGAVTVLRSAIVANETNTLELNVGNAIAERGYGILVDCDYRAEYDFTA